MLDSTKILFIGTPHFAATTLEELVERGFYITGVICQPDKQSGRGRVLEAPAVKKSAIKHNIPVFQPTSPQELTEAVKNNMPDLIVVVAYGKKIPDEALDVPKYKTLNIHGSLLPDYRGASCIAQAILDGKTITGISIIEMSADIDAGAIISQQSIEIVAEDTTAALTEKLAELSAKLIVKVIPDWVEGKIQPTEQEHEKATVCHLIKKEDGRIDWQKPAVEIERMIRAYIPWPNAYTFLDDKMIKILAAKLTEKNIKPGEILIENNKLFVGTGEKSLKILKMKPENSKEITAIDFINGHRDINGKVFQ
jgi:methionyl-tRNA formyltransferase